MRNILVLLIFGFTSLHLSAQVNTYHTRIGEYNGPVKTVMVTGATGATYDVYNPDGTLQMNRNTQKDYYVLLEWRESTIIHNTYDRETDKFQGQSIASYKMEESRFTVGNDDVTYYWTFPDHTMNMVIDGKVVWYSKIEDRCPDSYTLVSYRNGQVSDRIKVVGKDPDEYEAMISYEYYSEDK